MPFVNEDKGLIKNLHQYKNDRYLRILTEFSKKNCKREELDTLLKRFGKQEAPTTGM